MEFFFPDSQDQIDPNFDFLAERWSPFRVRQRDEHYAHEVHDLPPYGGILVSKSIVDGSGGGARYTAAQRHRLYRLGIRRFFRLDRDDGLRLRTLGDCGAFSYVRHERPPYSVEELVDFYERCGFDLGLSLDHVILGYQKREDDPVEDEWIERQELTLKLAESFLSEVRGRGLPFEPVGVAQGWSPESYATAVERLQGLGYERIALGGMVPLKTLQILACLREIDRVRDPEVPLHLLGVTRTDQLENVSAFAGFGVASFDSTSPFRQAFKDDKDNYYSPSRSYVALRVPQVEGNAKLQARVRAGIIPQAEAIKLERRCLERIRAYDAGETTLNSVLRALADYEKLQERPVDRSQRYRETLEDRPWQRCPCAVCQTYGVETIIFRGTERNKRRGFHNLFVFNQTLQRNLAALEPIDQSSEAV